VDLFDCGERLLSHTLPAEAELDADYVAGSNPRRQAVAYGSYEGGLRELIHILKYEQYAAANVLGRMLSNNGRLEFAFGLCTVVVVPCLACPELLKELQSFELIARAALKLDHRRSTGAQRQDIGTPSRHQSQTGLTRHQRRENIRVLLWWQILKH